VSPTRSEPPRRRAAYHHGDLREALIESALELIAQDGVHGFSIAEASRRIGVSSGAPYRHFADRDELLAAIWARALDVLRAMYLDSITPAEPAAHRLAALARAYVRFAAEHRPMFETALRAGIDKRRYSELLRADERVDAIFAALVKEICGDPDAAQALAIAVEATAHGHAVLMLDGDYGDGPDAAADAERQAGAATLALIEGRAALRYSMPSRSSTRSSARQ
jgi:AcrR family transcriptional regulator